jgi:DNA-binding PadR family transcriptional regulator
MALREVILTVLTQGRMTGYEITKNFDDVLSYFWRASHQQVYRELARLSDDGCVAHELVEQAGKPNKKIYRLTDRGREELASWVATETELPRPQYDLLIKLLAAPTVGGDVLLREIERQQAGTRAFLAMLQAKQQFCLRLPEENLSEYDRILFLALRRGLLLVEAQLEWLGEARAYFESGSRTLPGRKVTKATAMAKATTKPAPKAKPGNGRASARKPGRARRR